MASFSTSGVSPTLQLNRVLPLAHLLPLESRLRRVAQDRHPLPSKPLASPPMMVTLRS
jgi:hypothetical protein